MRYAIAYKVYKQSKWQMVVETYADEHDAKEREARMIGAGTFTAIVVPFDTVHP